MSGRSSSVKLTLFAFTVVVMVAGVLLTAVYLHLDVPDLPEIRNKAEAINLGTIVYSRDGVEIGRFYDEDRVWVPLEYISPHVIGALIATEDHRFFGHSGVDLRRLFSSMYFTLRGMRQGASTISMQLARNLFPQEIGSAPAFIRKSKEIQMAVKLERSFSKNEILELYLNTVAFGDNSFGIESAAQRYFGRSAIALELHEASLLVALVKGISWYNPRRHPDRARLRRNLVLERMRKHSFITSEEYADARHEPLHLRYRPRNPADGIAPHFMDHVRRVADEWAQQNDYNLYTDGLRIYTTLDSRIQDVALNTFENRMDALHAYAAYEWSGRATAAARGSQAAFHQMLNEERFDPFDYFWRTHPEVLDSQIRRSDRYRYESGQKGYDDALTALRADSAFIDSLKTAAARLEGGLVAIDPATGHVLAWVGGRDYQIDQYDKVAQARRQPASTFKPFVFGAAIEAGYSPYHRLGTSFTIQEQELLERTAGSETSGPSYSLREALAFSNNAITSRLVQELGPHQVARFARRSGIRSELTAVPSIGLGTSEVSLLEMTSAYATIVAHGIYSQPLSITRIEDQDGRTIARFESDRSRTIPSWISYTLLDMMREVVDHGTGSGIRRRHGIDSDVAGKTGTSQNYADGWFVMMHPDIVIGTWVGFNDRRITFRSAAHGEGGRNALDVVGDFFAALTELDPALRERRFEPPVGYVAPTDENEQQARLASRSAGSGGDGHIARDAFAEGLSRRRTVDSLDYALPMWMDDSVMEEPLRRDDSQSDPDDNNAEAALREEVRNLDSE